MGSVDVYIPEARALRDRKTRYVWLGILFLALYFISLIAAWVVFRSPLFKFKELRIEGNETVQKEDILMLYQSNMFRDSFFRYLLGYRNFLVWPEELTPEELRQFPVIKRAATEKDYGRGLLLIKVEERKAAGIWCGMQTELPRCFWFDDEGVLFDKAPLVEGNLIRAVRDYASAEIYLGARVLGKEQITNLLSVFQVFARTGLSVKEISLSDLGLQELTITTYEGPELYFSLRFKADDAAQVLDFLDQKPNFRKFEYVDFRVKDRVYYK